VKNPIIRKKNNNIKNANKFDVSDNGSELEQVNIKELMLKRQIEQLSKSGSREDLSNELIKIMITKDIIEESDIDIEKQTMLCMSDDEFVALRNKIMDEPLQDNFDDVQQVSEQQLLNIAKQKSKEFYSDGSFDIDDCEYSDSGSRVLSSIPKRTQEDYINGVKQIDSTLDIVDNVLSNLNKKQSSVLQQPLIISQPANAPIMFSQNPYDSLFSPPIKSRR